MRGRVGGRIGTSSPPLSYGANGVWALADVYATLRGSYGGDQYGYGPAWPINTVSISWPYQSYVGTVDWIDVTQTGGGTFSPDVQTTYPSLAYSWERSTNGGTTWTAVAGQTGATLTLTGQTTANDEDQYRLVADAGIKKFYGPAGTVRFDTVTITFPNQSWDNQPANLGFYTNGYIEGNTKTVAGGASVLLYYGALVAGQKYGANYEPTSTQWQTSTDGGSTWVSGTGVSDSDPADYSVAFTASSGDNGRKWRVIINFNSISVTSRVATLTVT